MLRKIRSQWFLLALAAVYLIGHAGTEHFAQIASKSWIRSGVLFTVMWAMGITLRPDAIRRSVRHPTASLLAIGMNMIGVPLLCLPAMWFLPTEYSGGLFVAGLVPCTLASASVWTRKAGGDDSIAMVTTVVTNLACIAVVPMGVQMVLAMHTRIPPLAQLEKLFWFVVLPLLLAQAMRRMGAAGWADRNKFRLAGAAQIGILTMVFIGAVVSQSYGDRLTWSNLDTVAMVAIAAVSVHLLAFGIAYGWAKLLHLPPGERSAIGIAGSQKTLMVGLQIAIDCGVSVLPMMIYHGGQLLCDTIIADRLKK
ncbi:bile acid:sodium symporter family protein [Roseiconus lacunae]|uniref:bile acid:sodium symporter family protein n=1 Tax=Roseiconus lacunae TaxID=2605694 RepID=UPI001E32937C|nr:bile acid:sodium symporter [Roseiconus lacunae]MCD0458461.1 bile acid:sodium symporter [Roseiconus lacunae]